TRFVLARNKAPQSSNNSSNNNCLLGLEPLSSCFLDSINFSIYLCNSAKSRYARRSRNSTGACCIWASSAPTRQRTMLCNKPSNHSTKPCTSPPCHWAATSIADTCPRLSRVNNCRVCSRCSSASPCNRASAPNGAPRAAANKVTGVVLLPTNKGDNQRTTCSPRGIGNLRNWQRLRIVGNTELGLWAIRTNRVLIAGSSNDLSKALAALPFMASAGSIITTL